MKTAQILDDKIVIKNVEDIKLDGRKGAIVKVLGCGLCGSDIVKFRQKISPNGTVLGHKTWKGNESRPTYRFTPCTVFFYVLLFGLP